MNTFAQVDQACRDIGMHVGFGGEVSQPEEPTPLIHEISPGDPFPVRAMGPLQNATLAIEDKTQAPVAIGAQSLLSATSLAAQALFDVQALAGVRPLSLFALTIAKSGERKSSCDALAMAPVQDFERALAETYREASASHGDDLEIWEQTRTKLIREASSHDQVKASGAKADLDALQAKPVEPLLPFLTATDPTFEGLTKNLALSRPALGIFSDEAGQFLGGHAMNSDNRMKTVAGLSKFWDGAPINRTRAGDGAATFHGRRLCMHLMVQPIIADTLLSDPTARDQGFLARFLLCHPPSTIGTRLRDAHSSESDSALAIYTQRLGDLLQADLPLTESSCNELEPPVLNMVPEAERLLRKFANTLERKQAPGCDLAEDTAFASKAAEQAVRIAGVLAVYAGETQITPEQITNGIELADWYLSEAVRLKNAASISADVRKAEKLRIWLMERWTENFIATTMIVQAGAANIKTASEARAVIPQLTKTGWLIPMEGGAIVQDKHRKEAWRIVRRAD